MVKSSLPNDDGGSGGARETKRMRCSIQSASTPQPNPCPAGEDREKSGQPGEGDSSKSVILSDPDVLVCPICLDPLTSPVFQCVDGHIACSSCCGKLENKCPSCGKEIGRIRCRAIEKVIDSAKIHCCYAEYGCKALVSYCQIREHEKTCKYPPCSCPFVDCLFRGSAPKLSQHISLQHSVSVVRFSYNRIFPLSLKHKWDTKSKKHIVTFIVLQEESDGVQFVVETHRRSGYEMNANSVYEVNVKCVEACPDKGKFSYDLIRNRHGSSTLRFQTSTKILEAKMDSYGHLLWLPSNFSSSELKIELCIWSKDASPPDIGKVI